jgi:Mn2+/Fe2+ NRAMP family transporter
VYIVVAIDVTHQWGRALACTVIPHVQFNKDYLALLVALLGTSSAPYLFFMAERSSLGRDA